MPSGSAYEYGLGKDFACFTELFTATDSITFYQLALITALARNCTSTRYDCISPFASEKTLPYRSIYSYRTNHSFTSYEL